MAEKLLADEIFAKIAHFVPPELHEHILIVGSLGGCRKTRIFDEF